MAILNVNSKVGRLIEAYIEDNYVLTSVQYLNTHLDTEALTRYIALSILPIDSEQDVLGLTVNFGERRDYLLVVQIYVREGFGSGDMEEVADTLEALLNRETRIIMDPGSGERGRIQFEVPDPPSPVNCDRSGWFQWNMVFSFRAVI